MKQLESGDFLAAWGGVSGLQYLLPAAWTALQPSGVGLPGLARLLSAEPARLAGVGHRKGQVTAGYDADLVVWEPEKAANTTAAGCLHRHKVSPYIGSALNGRVVATVVAGHISSLYGVMSKQACGLVIRD